MVPEVDNPTGPTESPAPAGAPEVTQQSFEGPEWLSTLPSELQSSKSLSKFKDVENLARGYVNAERMLGSDKIVLPKTDAEFAEVYSKLGCPSDISEYKVTYDDQRLSDEGKAAVAEDLKAFLPMAKEAGLNNKQAQAIFSKYAGVVSEVRSRYAAQVQSEVQAAEAELHKTYGETTEAKLTLANRALSRYADDNLIKAINDSGLGRNTSFVKMLIAIGEERAEEIGIDKTGTAGLLTPTDIQSQIAELMAHPAYTDNKHPEHKMVVERVQNLFARKVRK